MRSSAGGSQQNPQSATSASCASLSVVVVSSRSSVSRRGTEALRAAVRDLPAQLIVVSQNNDPAFATSMEHSGAEFVVAPVGSSRAEMCDLGMTRVRGSIVAVRDDVAIGDATWLDAYRAVLPRREATAPAALMESVVMDTLVAGRVGLADAAFTALGSRTDVASTDMAAAV